MIILGKKKFEKDFSKEFFFKKKKVSWFSYEKQNP